MVGVGEYSAGRLRDYASAWRATGCGCGDCGQCAARDLTEREADAIADCIDTLRRELFEQREVLQRIAGYTMSQFAGPYDMAAACIADAAEYLGI